MSCLVEFDLAEQAKKINAAVVAAEAGAKTALQHALVAGNLLIEAKKAVPNGGWESWVKGHCTLALRTAQAYMRLAKVHPELTPQEAQRVALLPVREAVRAIATPSEAPNRPDRLPTVREAGRAEAYRIGGVFQKASKALVRAAKDLEDLREIKSDKITKLRDELINALTTVDRLVAANAQPSAQLDVFENTAEQLVA